MADQRRGSPPTTLPEWEKHLQHLAERTSTNDPLGLRRYRRELAKYREFLSHTLKEMKQ